MSALGLGYRLRVWEIRGRLLFDLGKDLFIRLRHLRLGAGAELGWNCDVVVHALSPLIRARVRDNRMFVSSANLTCRGSSTILLVFRAEIGVGVSVVEFGFGSG